MPVWEVKIQMITIWSRTGGQHVKRNIDEIFKDMPIMFGIADDILVAGYEADGKDHDETVWRVLQRCRQVNLKLNKDKCHFRCTSVLFLGEIISQNGVKPDLQKIKALMEMSPHINKRRTTGFPGHY